MIRLGLRLTVSGGREALARLALIAAAVAIGVGLLLTTVASLNAVNTQNSRYAWLESSPASSAAAASPAPGTTRADPLWWRLRADSYQGRLIGRVDLAATGANSPVLPGIAKLPGPGQYYASPALATLLRTTPAAALGHRFPGSQIGTIGPAALPAPNSLVIVIGHSATDVSEHDGFDQITSISTTAPNHCSGNCLPGVGIDSNGLILILAVVAAALLFPVLIFIGGATRLSAARREQRFAAMRLIGATPRQIAVIATVESVVAALAGMIIGFGLFAALRPELARIPLTGDPFFTADLSLNLTDVLIVALGIPVAAAIAARTALRRVNISPLGVTRRVTPRPPRAWRAIPAVAGLAWLGYLAYFTDIGDASQHHSDTQALAYLAGIFLIMGGLVVAGPWLTMLGSRLMARRANRPATLIAARRLSDDPQAGFRAISGLVLALFVGTCAVGIITTIVAYNAGATGTSVASSGTVVEGFGSAQSPTAATSIPAARTSALTSIPGVIGVTTIRKDPNVDPNAYPPRALASCAQLATTPALGRCPRGTDVVTINPDFGGAVVNTSEASVTTWPATRISPAQLRSLPIDSVVVGTDGSTAAIEQARTLLGLAYPRTIGPQTISEIRSGQSKEIDSYQRLADIVILTSLPIAGCSLAVGVAGGLIERKRPFSLLRLTGSSLGMLRSVVTLETAGPLLISSVVSVGAGSLAAALFLHAQLKETLQPPGPAYYVIVFAGLLASFAVIASTLPLLKRMTGPETARNE